MSTTPEDLTLWGKIAAWMAGTAVTLTAVVWGDMKRRVGKVEKNLECKANKTEMEHRRTDIGKLFETTVQIQIDIATIKQQVSRVGSDMESEKRTRTEINREILAELRTILDKIK